MRWHSGLFLVIAFAMACRIIVLPALGGETMRPRWPLPIGLTRSMIRVVRTPGSVSSRSRSCGYSGTSLEKSGRPRDCSGSRPLILSSRTSALNFSRRSPSRGWRTAPSITSPLRRPCRRTWDSDTYTSLEPGRYPVVRMKP